MRPWLVVALVVVGVAAAGLVGYAVGEDIRNDDVGSPEQSQDKEALEAVGSGAANDAPEGTP
jgi:hypothetical protein